MSTNSNSNMNIIVLIVVVCNQRVDDEVPLER